MPLLHCPTLDERLLAGELVGALQSPRVRAIVSRSFGLDGEPPATRTEIAREFGVAPMRVRQICDAALRSMRRRLESQARAHRYVARADRSVAPLRGTTPVLASVCRSKSPVGGAKETPQ